MELARPQILNPENPAPYTTGEPVAKENEGMLHCLKIKRITQINYAQDIFSSFASKDISPKHVHGNMFISVRLIQSLCPYWYKLFIVIPSKLVTIPRKPIITVPRFVLFPPKSPVNEDVDMDEVSHPQRDPNPVSYQMRTFDELTIEFNENDVYDYEKELNAIDKVIFEKVSKGRAVCPFAIYTNLFEVKYHPTPYSNFYQIPEDDLEEAFKSVVGKFDWFFDTCLKYKISILPEQFLIPTSHPRFSSLGSDLKDCLNHTQPPSLVYCCNNNFMLFEFTQDDLENMMKSYFDQKDYLGDGALKFSDLLRKSLTHMLLYRVDNIILSNYLINIYLKLDFEYSGMLPKADGSVERIINFKYYVRRCDDSECTLNGLILWAIYKQANLDLRKNREIDEELTRIWKDVLKQDDNVLIETNLKFNREIFDDLCFESNSEYSFIPNMKPNFYYSIHLEDLSNGNYVAASRQYPIFKFRLNKDDFAKFFLSTNVLMGSKEQLLESIGDHELLLFVHDYMRLYKLAAYKNLKRFIGGLFKIYKSNVKQIAENNRNQRILDYGMISIVSRAKQENVEYVGFFTLVESI